MQGVVMKTRLSLPFTNFARSYATRRPIKPPPKIIDPLTSSSQANIQSFPDGVTFVHRPPPTAPSPFSTTILPASPLLRTSEPSSSSPDEPSSSSSPETVPVPPRMRREREFPDNRVLTETDFAEMRELRAANPTYYTRTRLAKKFNCPPFLVAQKVPLDSQNKNAAINKRETEHAEIRAKWGEQKSMVKAVKQKRREFW